MAKAGLEPLFFGGDCLGLIRIRIVYLIRFTYGYVVVYQYLQNYLMKVAAVHCMIKLVGICIFLNDFL